MNRSTPAGGKDGRACLVVPTEKRRHEARVAATPDTVKEYIEWGFVVRVQRGAGAGSLISDAQYKEAGAEIADDDHTLYRDADIILKVQAPGEEEIRSMPDDAVLVGMLSPYSNPLLTRYVSHGLTCFSLELIPRISRAQGMDVLSSQANIAGYKSVLLAAHYYRRFFPMMMTAAGTITPARVLVLGAGVAGLQAIATARRLGAVVEAFDVRSATKEQVESLGAKFIRLEGVDAEDEGGYARELTPEEQSRLETLVAERTAAADIVITTAQIPGRKAPELVRSETVERMRPGSVIVDLAAAGGGNCRLTKIDEIITYKGVTIIGLRNVPSLMAADASRLYARNILHFVRLMRRADTGAFDPEIEDEILQATMLCRGGEWCHGNLPSPEESKS